MMTDDESCPMCGGRPGKFRRVVRAGAVAICDGCGGWYRTPRPTASDLKDTYTEKYYDSWGLTDNPESVRLTKDATFSPILDQLETMTAEHDEKRRILDVGAATGLLLDFAAERGWEPYAVELNPYSAGILREKLGAERVFEGELADYPVSNGCFDVITMTDVIEHVLDVAGTLKVAASLLKEGGVLCITTPRIDSFSRGLLGKQWLHFKEEHIQYFSRRGIIDVLDEAGFEEIGVCGHYKHLTIAYIHQQLQAFPHWLLTPAIGLIHSIAPKRLRVRPMRFRCGEMLVVGRLAKRKGD
jgi:2-polyprenyl-3-methyl-5-hydroxy-6-metoxy-1,4-benzoquinol methylase